jgi:hypothetical protein
MNFEITSIPMKLTFPQTVLEGFDWEKIVL